MLHKVSSLNTINDGISTKCTSGQKICTKHSVFIIHELFYLLEKYFLEKNIPILKMCRKNITLKVDLYPRKP